MRCELLDPDRVRLLPSYRLRHPAAFSEPSFFALKASLAHTAGNVQPIKVRSCDDGHFDLAFGSRRLRALQELGLPVLAVIADRGSLSDPVMVAELVASNAGDQVSLIELGGLLSRALGAGLYPSRRRAADCVGLSLSTLALAVDLAELPLQLFAAFKDPRVLTPTEI